MVIASGFVEVNELENVETVMGEIQKRGIEVSEVKDEKVVFLIERKDMAVVRAELDSLKDIDNVKNVHLAYYSLEGSDEGPDFKNRGAGNA
jgi:nitrate reductase NapAB chaperone NapD